MMKILFVDDEPHVLEGLRRTLRKMRHEWTMYFVDSGAEALEVMAGEQIDVLVTDMIMPGMDGATLLTEVRERYPRTVRLVLSGHSGRETILKLIGAAHQYMAKPCDLETLKTAIQRAHEARDSIETESLMLVISQIQSIPSMPETYARIMAALQSEEFSLHEVAEIIGQDVGLTAKILQLSNSSFFGFRYAVSDPVQATVLLGGDIISALVVSVQLGTMFNAGTNDAFSVEAVGEHSLLVASSAKRIAELETTDKTLRAQAFASGMLHDTGKLLLGANFPKDYRRAIKTAMRDEVPLPETERTIFGVRHSTVGAYLLGIWGLPDPVVRAVAHHHSPEEGASTGFSPLVAVHVANAFVHEADSSYQGGIDHDYLESQGFAGRLDEWREACIDIRDEAA